MLTLSLVSSGTKDAFMPFLPKLELLWCQDRSSENSQELEAGDMLYIIPLTETGQPEGVSLRNIR